MLKSIWSSVTLYPDNIYMSEFRDKLITGILIAGCLLFFFMQASSGSLSVDGAVPQVLTKEESQQMFEQLGGAAGAKPVTMFVTSWCPVCRGLEQELSKRGVDYITVDVEKSRDAALFYQKVTQGASNAVPVTVVGRDVVLGYNASAILNSYARL